MLQDLVRALAASFAGTLGFALLLRAPRRSWVPASVIGAAAYLLYWALSGPAGLSEAWSVFIGTVFSTILALLCARRMQMIGTIFASLAIVPFVPGLALYRCMSLLGQGATDAGAKVGVSAMTAIAMIALGAGVGSFLFRMGSTTALRMKAGRSA